MLVMVSDSQLIAETSATIFTLIQPSVTNSHIVMTNSGVNTFTYRFDQLIDGTWTAMGDPGSIYNDAMVASLTRELDIPAGSMQVRLVGNASGGTLLQFGILRFVDRQPGGNLPIVNI